MEQNDHDALVTLVADMKNLTATQAAFHKEIKESLADLKNNYQFRLDSHEQKINDLIATRNDFRQRLADSEQYTKFLVWFMGVIGALVFGLLLWHITNGFTF